METQEFLGGLLLGQTIVFLCSVLVNPTIFTYIFLFPLSLFSATWLACEGHW